MRAVLMTLALLLAATGCAQATATNEAPSAWDTKAANPRFAQAAQRALASASQPEPGWRIGVVLAENNDSWAITALTPDGVVYLAGAKDRYDCPNDDDGRFWWDELPLMLDPGDLFTWAGDDRVSHNVCANQVRVLRKAAA